MKISKSLFLAFAGLGLFACSNEDVTTDATVDGGKSKTMVISLNGISEGSRATSEAEEEGQVALNKVAIFYTTATGSVGHVTTLSNADGENWTNLTNGTGYVEHSLPASIARVYVVGNYDDLLGNLNEIGTAEILEAKVINAAAQQTFSNVLLYGKDIDGLESVEDGDGEHTENVVKAELTISPLVSRLEISGIQCEDLGNQYSSIDLKKIGLANFYTTTTVGGTIAGLQATAVTVENQETIWGNNLWAADVITGATLTSNAAIWNPTEGVFSYNIVPNSTTEKAGLQVRLLVEAKRGTTVDPISNTLIANVGQQLAAGKIYKMTYKFKEENVGPWDPDNTQCVIVNVTVSNWDVVTLTPSFE